MRSVPSRSGYLALTFALAAAGAVMAAWLGWDVPAVAAGAFGAWAIQAVAYWKLVAALDEERSAIRQWVLGMGARLGGLVIAVVVARRAPEGGREALLAFGVAILMFLLLEAVWLARRPVEWAGRSGSFRVPAEGAEESETLRQVDG